MSRLAFFTALLMFSIAIPVMAARTCYEPQKQDGGGEKLRALGKRAAYAAFLSDECGFSSDVQRKYMSLLKEMYGGSSTEQSYADDFRSKKRSFAQEASFLGIKKRCMVDTAKTRAFVNDAVDDVGQYSESAASMTRAFESKRSEFEQCKSKREEELAYERRVQQQADYEKSEEFARKKAVIDLEKGWRESFLESRKGTYVLKLRNPSQRTAEFQLKCCVAGGDRCKTFNMVIPTNDSTELGFAEGWPGNFSSGEKCHAYFKGEEQWWYGLK